MCSSIESSQVCSRKIKSESYFYLPSSNRHQAIWSFNREILLIENLNRIFFSHYIKKVWFYSSIHMLLILPVSIVPLQFTIVKQSILSIWIPYRKKLLKCQSHIMSGRSVSKSLALEDMSLLFFEKQFCAKLFCNIIGSMHFLINWKLTIYLLL